ncbi:unnamed protein product [Rhizophagus irregularis]|nr:unnamed protein product [Rhizophagus irregularis]
MNPLIAEMAPKFRKFTLEMITNVEFYVKHGIFSITQIYPLLQAKYPDHLILKKNLYNIIQKVKKQQQPEWFFEFCLFENDQKLTSLIWISPDQCSYYIRFHEVLIFDCTARTNHYDMVLCLFLVVDNNTRSSALLEDETENSFI